MYIVAEEPILDVRMLDLAVGLHVVPARELLPAHRALVALRPMDVGVVPAIRHDLVAAHTTVQGGQRARQLDEQGGVVDVVVSPVGRRRAAAATAAAEEEDPLELELGCGETADVATDGGAGVADPEADPATDTDAEPEAEPAPEAVG